MKTKQRTKFLPLGDKNSRWWINSKEEKITWYIKKGDDYWLIPGSEFPEKKINMKTGKINKIKSNDANLKLMLFIAIGSFLGVTLAALLISILI